MSVWVYTKIDKLSILGVRSFDNTRSETIQFHTPLTLIVGLNGSGKTTIIECLKYATTGDLPPNSKGGAFIHDPKLCGEKEVLAQVKLSFKSTSGAKMVATRSLQLTVKKTVRSQKTLEGQLLMLKDGERTAISSRVAELDQIMPQYLGVSRAILDSVIFCHQDESLWPMSEPSVLKKKFDEIFEALKYTKAIDNIKVLRKKQNEELGKYKIIEQHAKEDKDKGVRAEKRSNELSEEIEVLRNHTIEIGHKIKDASHKSQEAWEHAAKFETIVAQLEGRRIEARAKEESVEDDRQRITQMTESDDELQSMLDRYEERVKVYERDKEAQVKRYSDLTKDMEQGRQELSAKEREIGTYEAQRTHYERQVENRESFIKETARRHKIRGFDLEINDEKVRDFMQRIEKMAREQQATFENARRETQEELQKAQKALNKLNERKSALHQSKQNAISQISTSDRKFSTLKADVDKIDVDEGSKATLESSVEDVDARLSKAKADLEAVDIDKQVRDTDSQISSLEHTRDNLEAELLQATNQAEESAGLNYAHKALKENQKKLKTMVGAHGDTIGSVLGRQWTPATVERELQSALEQRSADIKDAEFQRDGTNRELEKLDFTLNSCRVDLKKKRQELATSKGILDSVTDNEPEEYPKIVSGLETSRDMVNKDIVSFSNLKGYYTECLKTAENNDICRMCERPFKGDKDRERLVKKLQRQVSNAAAQEAADELKEVEAELKTAREASASYDTWQRLRQTEIPALEAVAQQLESHREKLLGEIEEQDRVVVERTEARRDVEVLSKNVQSITKYNTEIAKLENDVKELSAKQKQAGLSRGVDQIHDDRKQLNERFKAVTSSRQKLVADRDRARNQINSLELESRDIKSKLSTAVYQIKEKNNIVAQMEDLKTQNVEQREAMKVVDRDLQELIPQISQAQAKYDDIDRLGADKDRELQQAASKLQDSVRDLKTADQDIKRYIDDGGPQALARTKRDVDNIRDDLKRMETEQRWITVEVKKVDDQLRNHNETKRSITDNQRYRRNKRSLAAVHAEIEELEAHNAEADKDRYEREGNKWQMERNKLSAEQASLIGQLKSKDDQLKQLINDWETDYKDAGLKYKEAHIRVETTKAAVEDLGRYGGALDKAIMKYHSIKMEEINRIIEELWKKTYQGTDVDTILIRSDNETQKGNKSYNYRVCMLKQDAEMDMRGRCSAGQKVLASIIIRLALAECFGVNCGLIALDEPTTNLDRENIRALAESLAEIIRVRRQQSNFQLIVITHDEDFLRFMGCADFCDHYWRVSRTERQKSIIERQNIAEVI
ncbi:hypothetical protein B0A49_04328 [Cryomyces minteri]|uniref:DNA repair protein RAD50 n=1 Tax=Cryomyces minteri TaxID=331657 RepID=A0A4V5NG68_9PEZI|nr:hypothetical protein B0A49_04328 [Cryomyces minteri]